MSTLVVRERVACVFLASVLLATVTCDGAGPDEDQVSVNQDELGTKLTPQALKRLARNFRVTATDSLVMLTRSGQTVAIPLSALTVEVELAPAPAPAIARRAPVLVAPEIPPAPARRAQPSAFTADVPCSGVATRARVPVTEVTFPEVPPDQVPRAVRVPALVVTPAVDGMPVVATRVRVPAQAVDATPASSAQSRRTPRRVMVPEITLGLIDATDTSAATLVEVQVPARATDDATFQRVDAK